MLFAVRVIYTLNQALDSQKSLEPHAQAAQVKTFTDRLGCTLCVFLPKILDQTDGTFMHVNTLCAKHSFDKPIWMSCHCEIWPEGFILEYVL